MANFLIAAALAAAVPATPAAPTLPDANPAMWVVNDQDTVIYLFGTFHALDGTTDWFNDEVATAFNASDALVLETIVPRPVEIPQTPLPRGSSGRGLGVTPPASFLASTCIDQPVGSNPGMQVEKGADEVLRRAAEQIGKPVEGLESFQSQLDMFARLPAPSARPATAPKKPGDIGMPKVMEWMQTAWNKGDQRIFTNVIEQMRKTSPQTYEMMFTRRNANWAAWIARRLEQPGTVFVAVGAGHLAGMDSVQAKLSELGVKSERIN